MMTISKVFFYTIFVFSGLFILTNLVSCVLVDSQINNQVSGIELDFNKHDAAEELRVMEACDNA
jgi:hypothetical protein